MDVRKGMESMHPIREEFDKYLSGELANTHKQNVEKHLLDCEFCSELVENLKLRLKWMSDSLASDLTQNLVKEADMLYDLSLRGRIIPLIQLERIATGKATLLAADGQLNNERDLVNLSTVYSENPEIVLRLMKDNKAGECYVQVISDDPGMYENMLVELPDIGRSIITDSSGLAKIDDIDPSVIGDLRWQIRLPEAVFDLESLTFDPDHSEYRKETILESDQGDSIRVSLEGKGDGKQIELEVLRLDGKTEFGPLQMVVTIDGDMQRVQLDDKNSVLLETGSLDGKMRIRLYT